MIKESFDFKDGNFRQHVNTLTSFVTVGIVINEIAFNFSPYPT